LISVFEREAEEQKAIRAEEASERRAYREPMVAITHTFRHIF